MHKGSAESRSVFECGEAHPLAFACRPADESGVALTLAAALQGAPRSRMPSCYFSCFFFFFPARFCTMGQSGWSA